MLVFLEFIEKADSTFALDVERTAQRDVIIEIFNNFWEDIAKTTNSLMKKENKYL